ncbi:MAG TPA: heavy metal translocating P-type ATPase, partial [Polyangiaceae bacterium]
MSDVPGACPKCGMALERAHTTAEASPEDNHELTSMQRRFAVCAVFTVPLVVIAMGMLAPPWVEFLLALPVVTGGAWPIWERAALSIRHAHPNMFTLIGLGTAASLAFSVPQIGQHHGNTYFEASAVIVTLVLLGQVLELRARESTRDALRSLLALTPKTVRRLTHCGHERDVPIGDLKTNETFRVRPGERIATDGVVEDGASTVDEAMLTGEAAPIAKKTGDAVTGGTINGAGTLVVRATEVGAETRLARIVALVDAAQRTKAPAQRIADAVSTWFVYAVVAIAIAAFFAWNAFGPAPALHHAVANAVAVLIVACPCALGLATPMAVAVGAGRGAKAGVLVRDAEALELFARATVVAIDKTGTLTEGKPRVVAIDPVEGITKDELLRVAASLETGSEHPLAGAILAAAHEAKVTPAKVDGFEAIVGRGVRGSIDGVAVKIGNAAFAGAEAPTDARTRVYVAKEAALLGSLAIDDPLRSGAKEAVSALANYGVRVVLLTGDAKAVADRVARDLGIADVVAEATPEHKAAAIDRLKKDGAVVAMVG